MKGLIPAAAIVAAASLFVARPAAAQMTGTPAPGYLAAPGVPSSTMPEPLREIDWTGVFWRKAR